jgi:hypothetical protein
MRMRLIVLRVTRPSPLRGPGKLHHCGGLSINLCEKRHLFVWCRVAAAGGKAHQARRAREGMRRLGRKGEADEVRAFEKVQNPVKSLLGSTRRQRITRHDRAAGTGGPFRNAGRFVNLACPRILTGPPHGNHFAKAREENMSRVALVTGGTRGIGAATCKALKAAGYKVAANYGGNDHADAVTPLCARDRLSIAQAWRGRSSSRGD